MARLTKREKEEKAVKDAEKEAARLEAVTAGEGKADEVITVTVDPPVAPGETPPETEEDTFFCEACKGVVTTVYVRCPNPDCQQGLDWSKMGQEARIT